MKLPHTVHTLVVGRGLDALACARRLAMRGCTVAVVDTSVSPLLDSQLSVVPRSSRDANVDFLFDAAGRHRWGDACRKLGFQVELDTLDMAIGELRYSDGRRHLLPARSAAFFENLEARYPKDRRALAELRRASGARVAVADVHRSTFWRRMGRVLRDSKRIEWLDLSRVSVASYLERLGLTEAVQRVLFFLCRELGVDADAINALSFLQLLNGYLTGAALLREGATSLHAQLKHPSVHYLWDPNAYFRELSSRRWMARWARSGSTLPARYRAYLQDGAIDASHLVWTLEPETLVQTSNIRRGLFQSSVAPVRTAPRKWVWTEFATSRSLEDYGFHSWNQHLISDASLPEGSDHPLECARCASLFVEMTSLRDHTLLPFTTSAGTALGFLRVRFLDVGAREASEDSLEMDDEAGEEARERVISYGQQRIVEERLLAAYPQLEGEFVGRGFGRVKASAMPMLSCIGVESWMHSLLRSGERYVGSGNGLHMSRSSLGGFAHRICEGVELAERLASGLADSAS